MKTDLHFHSTYSDGKLSPKELIEQLKEKEITFACLTDHDSIMGSSEFVSLAKENNILSYPSLELSTYTNNESIHVLAYFKSLDSITVEFKEYLLSMIEIRRERMRNMVDNMNKLYNFNISFEEIEKEHPYMIERPHLAEKIKNILNISIKEIFDKYIGENCPGYIKSSKISTLEGIEMIHKAGGIAILAHPYQYRKNDPKELLKMPFDGVEAFYYPQQTRSYKQYKKYARKHDLLMTGGSDFHRLYDEKHSNLGSKDYDDEFKEEFIKKIESL